MSYLHTVNTAVTAPTSATEAMQRLRRLAEELARDPQLRMVQAHFGAPAPSDAIDAWRGRAPDDLLAFLTACDGVVIEWETVEIGKDFGRLAVPSSGDLVARPARGGEPYAYIMIDGYADGLGSYYELPVPFQAGRAQVVYTSAENERYHRLPVCQTFLEYLAIGEAHRFQSEWVDAVSSENARANMAKPTPS